MLGISTPHTRLVLLRRCQNQCRASVRSCGPRLRGLHGPECPLKQDGPKHGADSGLGHGSLASLTRMGESARALPFRGLSAPAKSQTSPCVRLSNATKPSHCGRADSQSRNGESGRSTSRIRQGEDGFRFAVRAGVSTLEHDRTLGVELGPRSKWSGNRKVGM